MAETLTNISNKKESVSTTIQIDMNALKAEKCRRSFFYFLKEFWSIVIPQDYVHNWHIPYLCEELEQVVRRVANNQPKDYDLIINIPPGTTKSTIVTVMLPVWSWIIDPKMRNLTVSYSSSLSTDHSLKSRDILKSDKFRAMFPTIGIKQDQDNKTHYKNTQGGERYATSVTGAAMGFHAHMIIVDDPLNTKGAGSEAERATANEFMDRTLSTRKVNKSITPTILVMQRLHMLDCTGNWLKDSDRPIKHICLPAELSKDVKPPILANRYKNNLLDPVRLSKKDLAELRVALGSYGYAGQIMQTPSPEQGGVWQKWCIPFDELPRDDKGNEIKLLYLGADWDLAYTKDTQNSASAYVVAGVYEKNMYIIDLGFRWLEFPQLIEWMKSKDMGGEFVHHIESKASGKSAKQSLESSGLKAKEVNVTGGDKISRAILASPYAEAGRVYCKRNLLDKLYHDSKQGILLFPNGAGDDLQDAFVQAINRLLNNPHVFFF